MTDLMWHSFCLSRPSFGASFKLRKRGFLWVPSMVLRKFSQPPVRLLLEQRRVQVAAGAPFAV